MGESKGKWIRLVPVAVFAALAVAFAFALNSGDPSKLPSALIGKSAPATDLAGVEELARDGRSVPGFKSTDLATGKVSVVNFWASWCGPCVEEHPLLVELKDVPNVALYGINYKDQASAARRFLGRYGNPFVAVGADPQGRAAIEWGVYGMPETFVVDGAGRIVFKHVGPLSRGSIANKLLPAIEKARAAPQAGSGVGAAADPSKR